MSALARLCTFSYELHRKLNSLITVGLSGIWLGLLDQEDLHSVVEIVYSKMEQYDTADHNRMGLWDWEIRAMEKYFGGCKRLLVAAAGGGREVLALRKRGLEVDGFEAHPELVRFANEFLEQEGYGNGIRQAPWDECPEYEGMYDGVILGWGAYMHIRGRKKRIALLRALRRRIETGSPLLLSFSTIDRTTRKMRITTRIANTLARPLGRDPVELGDWLEPYFKHHFTPEQLEAELREGGFDMMYFAPEDTGHSVGIAVDRAPD